MTPEDVRTIKQLAAMRPRARRRLLVRSAEIPDMQAKLEGLTGWPRKMARQCLRHPKEAELSIIMMRVRKAQRDANDVPMTKDGKRKRVDLYRYWDIPATPPVKRQRLRRRGTFTYDVVRACNPKTPKDGE